MSGNKSTPDNDEKHGGVEHAEEVRRHHNVAAVESTKISDAIANGIAANVDDFMVGCLKYISSLHPLTFIKTLVHEADEANERERTMSLRTAFSVYPKAIGWSIVLSSSLIMEGYDTAAMGSFWAFPVCEPSRGLSNHILTSNLIAGLFEK